MRIGLLIVSIFFSTAVFSQDTLKTSDESMGTVSVFKDYRLDVLAKKEAEFNDSKLLANGTYAMKGFRLMVLSTNDRAMAMKIRTELLQRYPDEKIYMTFQAPYLKLKIGNFIEKNDAEKFKNDIIRAKIITSNIYIVPEMIEAKAEDIKEKEDK